MIDPNKVKAAIDGSDVLQCADNSDGTLEVTTRRGGKKFNRDEVLADACLECPDPAPQNSDVLLDGHGRQASGERYERVREFESRSAGDKWEYFTNEISKCIRCYACRQVCPNCYCKVCFADQTKPRWIDPGDDPSDLMLYHIGRIFHQAGRCVECDACVRACPMGVDLRVFTQKVVKDVEDLFDYMPGSSLEELPPLCTFKQDDSESFITDPQEG